MFAYCGNNSVNCSDPTGHAYQGIHEQINYNEYEHTYGGLRENFYALPDTVIDAVVIDFSWSFQRPDKPGIYIKGGASVVIDFQNTEAYLYFHGGGGVGLSSGPSLSAGYVGDYVGPEDYEGWFRDVNGAYYLGIDHCWSPDMPYDTAPKATLVSFSFGPSGGYGRDFFGPAIKIADWE